MTTAADCYRVISFPGPSRVNKPGVDGIDWVEDHSRSFVPNWKNLHLPYHAPTPNGSAVLREGLSMVQVAA